MQPTRLEKNANITLKSALVPQAVSKARAQSRAAKVYGHAQLHSWNLGCIASITLALCHFSFSVAPPVSRKRAANGYCFFKLPTRIPTEVPLGSWR
jgi:hypothetical protein